MVKSKTGTRVFQLELDVAAGEARALQVGLRAPPLGERARRARHGVRVGKAAELEVARELPPAFFKSGEAAEQPSHVLV